MPVDDFVPDVIDVIIHNTVFISVKSAYHYELRVVLDVLEDVLCTLLATK